MTGILARTSAITDDQGNVVDIDSLPKKIVNNANGTTAYIEYGPDAAGSKWRLTYTYPDALTTAITGLTKQ